MAVEYLVARGGTDEPFYRMWSVSNATFNKMQMSDDTFKRPLNHVNNTETIESCEEHRPLNHVNNTETIESCEEHRPLSHVNNTDTIESCE